ncbi:hypothetical protein RUND412_010389 [Rhizina undulata]
MGRDLEGPKIPPDPQETSVRNAAETFDVKRTTLNYRYNGQRQSRREATEHLRLLSPGQERAIVRWCQRLDDWGLPPRTDLVKQMAQMLASASPENKDKIVGKRWLARFLNC